MRFNIDEPEGQDIMYLTACPPVEDAQELALMASTPPLEVTASDSAPPPSASCSTAAPATSDSAWDAGLDVNRPDGRTHTFAKELLFHANEHDGHVAKQEKFAEDAAVSYTHLTLPTICSV